MQKVGQTAEWGFKEYVKAIGPAIVIAALVIGPGSVTTLSSMGSQYSYLPLWIIVAACCCSFIYQEPAIRIAGTQGMGVLDAIRIKYGTTLATILWAMMLLGTLAFQAGNFMGAAMAMNYFVPAISLQGWTALMILMGLGIALASKYNLVESFIKWLVAMMVVGFVITAMSSGPGVGQLMSEGFSFTIPGGNWFLVLALISTTMVPDIPVALSALIKGRYFGDHGTEKDRAAPQWLRLRLCRIDLTVGVAMTGLLSIAILVCSAAVLFPQGIVVKSAADMAKQLEPLLGRYAGILFSLGLWAAAISSGLFRMQLVPMTYNQAQGLPDTLANNRSRFLTLIAGLVPLCFVFLWGRSPVELIITAQAVNGLLLPVLAATMWKLASDRSFLGEHANGPVRNMLMGIVLFLTLALGIRTFLSITGLL